jgi:hypothetical protein
LRLLYLIYKKQKRFLANTSFHYLQPKIFVRVFIIAFLNFCLLSNNYCQVNYRQQQVNYTIDVTLHDEDNMLDGFERMEYINNSPDTLTFLYMHLWMNAYKNDRTAFSEQLLQNDLTNFYFSDEERHGYVNRLEFKVNDTNAIIEETNNIDIIKLHLPQPLKPHQKTVITTPFHVKLPYNFSRGGYIGQSYMITQWYPKAALYDKDGWHEMPYLDEGEYYNDFGNYNVSITLPSNYQVAATGVLESTEENVFVNKQQATSNKQQAKTRKPFFRKKVVESIVPPSSNEGKTLHYSAGNVSDFAWFADKTFIVKTDTIQLSSQTVKASCYILPQSEALYSNCIRNIKRAVRFYSAELGEYPFPAVNVVCCPKEGPPGGMEYPMVTLVNEQNEKDLDETIAHEIGHNWFMAILSSNERDHAWMDEGMNTYVENKYMATYYPETNHKEKSLQLPHPSANLLDIMVSLRKDQPIETTSEEFNDVNYGEVVYTKTGLWMEYLEKILGQETMLRILHTYFQEYAFKHPQPEDFKKVAEAVSNKDLSSAFKKLNETGFVDSSNSKKQTRVKFLMPAFDNKYNYLTIAPIIGANSYDKLMIGGAITNYTLPLKTFNFLVAPMYATGTSKLTGAARISYNHFTKRSWFEGALSGITYSIDQYQKDDGRDLYLGLNRIVPSAKFTLYNRDLRQKTKWIFHVRSFILGEDELLFNTVTTPTDTTYVTSKTRVHTVINQLQVSYENNRILYPCNGNITIDQGKEFLRIGLTGNYFFNYNEKGEGINARTFVGKFFYLTSRNDITEYNTDRYHLNMSGPKGYEDYTYSGYFAGRNEFEGWKSQQIMERDGFFKVRTDLLGNKIGKTDDWLIAINFCGDIPKQVNPFNALPFKVPIKFFLDIGSYSEAWKVQPATGRFLYDAGLQFSLLKSGLNIYFPLLYSKVYSDYFKSTLGDNHFWKTVSFDINLSVLQPSKLLREVPL